MIRAFYDVNPEVKAREGWTGTKFSILTPAYGEYKRLERQQLRSADAIFCTVPSTKPLFDHTILTSTEGRKKGRLIVAVGSYKPHMIEVPKEILQQAVKLAHEHRHYHKHATEGGVVVVDTLTGCMTEAGEIVQSGLHPHQLVEIGELVMLEGQIAADSDPEEDLPELDMTKISLNSEGSGSSLPAAPSEDAAIKASSRKSSFTRLSRRSSRSSLAEKHGRSLSTDSSKTVKKEDAMTKWLSEGNVIYKSVGMGLMDLVVGDALLNLAISRGIGTTIPDF